MQIELNDNILQITLRNSEKEALGYFASKLKYGVSCPPELYVKSVGGATALMLRELQRTLREAKMVKEKPSAIRILNLPMDSELPPTPLQGEAYEKKSMISENVLIALGQMMGEVYAMRPISDRLVDNLVPAVEHKEALNGLGYDRELSHHTEHAAAAHVWPRDMAPDFLILLGLKQDPVRPQTCLADVRKALVKLSEYDRTLLQLPFFRKRLPTRFLAVLPEAYHWSEPAPLVQSVPGGLKCRATFYGDSVKPTNGPAELAFQRFRDAINSCSVDLVIEPGEAVIINNALATHSRKRFNATFDTDGRAARWLQRVFVTNDLQKFAGWRTEKNRCFMPPLDKKLAD